jgi:opacity protein-like surface antigen
MKHALTRITSLLCALALVTPAAAQAPPAPAPAAPPSAPSDIVRLRDGSMFRGTIQELVVGDHVDLQLHSGELRRIPMKDVAYAGPAARDPSAAPAAPAAPPPSYGPLVTVDATSLRVHFESADPNMAFSLRTGSATVAGSVGGRGYVGVATAYTDLCGAPCDVTLPAGTYRLALSKDGRGPVEAEEAAVLREPSTVQGTYIDHRGLRTAGWVSLLGGIGIGTILMASAFAQKTTTCDGAGSCSTSPSVNQSQVGAGAAVSLVGGLVGLILILQGDSASVRVLPLRGAAATPAPPRP